MFWYVSKTTELLVNQANYILEKTARVYPRKLVTNVSALYPITSTNDHLQSAEIESYVNF